MLLSKVYIINNGIPSLSIFSHDDDRDVCKSVANYGKAVCKRMSESEREREREPDYGEDDIMDDEDGFEY